MRRLLWRKYIRQFLDGYPLRWREFWFWRKQQKAWIEGYGNIRPGALGVGLEALVRALELAGVGLLLALVDVLVFGGRYWLASSNGESLVTVRQAALHEPSWTSARLRVAYVFGYVIHTAGPLQPSVLTHELVHVRQFERWGWAYVAKAWHAQWWGAGYAYPEHLRQVGLPAKPVRCPRILLNAEQEAAWWEDVHRQVLGMPMRWACE